MKRLILLFVFVILSITQLYAQGMKIEPVYGVERTMRYYPEPAKQVTRTLLGMRGVYGVPAFSLEAEVNQSNTIEEFPDQNLKVTYKTQKALLGFRTYPLHGKNVGFFFRFGASAKKEDLDIVENEVSSTQFGPVVVNPYAGIGLTIALGDIFALNAGATMIYNRDAEDESDKYEARYDLGFSIKAGKF